MAEASTYQAARVHRRHLQCRHFQGAFAQPPCSAGVDLIAMAGPRKLDGWLRRIPCRIENHEPVFSCDQRDVPLPATEEEIAAGEAQVKAHASNVFSALALIRAEKGGSGAIECPACHGRLSWQRASNGHVWGQCQTARCLSWMQ